MSAHSPITRQTVGKTFIVASSILGFGAIAQVSAITWAFVTRFQAASLRSPAAAAPSGTAKARAGSLPPLPEIPDTREALALTNPFSEVPQPPGPAVPPVPPPITPPPKPQPVPVARLEAPPPPQTRFDELVEQGKKLRERGDMSTALTRLREANALEPGNALALAEIAVTYEKMGLMDRAAEQWKRIYEMGEAAGSYFIAADARLQQSRAVAMLNAQGGAGGGGQGSPSTTNPGAQLGLGTITLEEARDPAATRKFVLRVPLRARPRTRVEVRDVVIQVLFYDTLDGQTPVQTNANVNSRWASTPPDWAEGDTEVLEVEYSQPAPTVVDASAPTRKYYGYIVRLYYKDELQDTRSEPVRLGAQFPAPQTLQKDAAP